ncbi:unnamed protein product [Paramecium octaurelia]|uniref:Uncharacterized protein n=1 Tax=Paramecium octaurelia TaxID=43137 RepID=A0A8S1YQD6_PAROT|nr:unnamed protein product [Paramecium octaurelia]
MPKSFFQIFCLKILILIYFIWQQFSLQFEVFKTYSQKLLDLAIINLKKWTLIWEELDQLVGQRRWYIMQVMPKIKIQL